MGGCTVICTCGPLQWALPDCQGARGPPKPPGSTELVQVLGYDGFFTPVLLRSATQGNIQVLATEKNKDDSSFPNTVHF